MRFYATEDSARDGSYIQQFLDIVNINNLKFRVIVAALGIVTTKAIFALGFHYPLRLLLLHLLVVAILDIVQWSSRWMSRFVLRNSEEEQARHTTSWLNLLLRCLHAVCVTGALVCEYQALLKFRTLPALVMLLSLDWSRIPGIISSQETSLFRKVTACLGCLFGFVMILGFDQRMYPDGLRKSVLAVVLGAAAQILDRFIDTSHNAYGSSPQTSSQSRAIVLLLAIPFTMFQIYQTEYNIYIPVAFSSLLCILAINVIAVAVMLRSNWSIFRIYDFSQAEIEHDGKIQQFFPPILLQGLVAAGFAIVSLPLQPCIWQYVGFVVALGILSLSDHQSYRGSEPDAEYMHKLLPWTSDTEISEFNAVNTKNNMDKSPWTRYLSWGLLLVASIVLSSFPTILSWIYQPLPLQRVVLNTDLATTSNTKQSMDFVVSRFDESVEQVAYQLNSMLRLPTIQNLTTRILIYSTGDDDREIYRDELQDALESSTKVIVKPRENVGREGAAFLHHINSTWDDFADHSIFMQAEMHDLSGVQLRLQNYFVPETGFLSLSHVREYCTSCETCWDHSTWSERKEILENILERANPGANTCQGFTLTYRGQFVVSRKRIQAQDKQLFSDLLDELTNPESVMHSQEYIDEPWLPEKVDSMNSPLGGYTLERLWGVLMRCSDVGLVTRCPSFMASSVAEVMRVGKPALEDCQCLDER